MAFNCKKLLCVLVAVITVFSLTSVMAFAEESTEISQDASEVVGNENNDTIFEIIANGEGTTLERLAHGGKVTLVGMIVVFSVLIILMAVLYVFQWVQKMFKSKPEQKSKPVASTATPASAPSVNAPANAVANEEEIVAVATVAIAAARGENDCAFNVISITQID